MRSAVLFLALSCLAVAARAQGPMGPPTYQRTRGGDGMNPGGSWHPGHGGNVYGGFYNPYFYSPPVVTGYWYQRPYPYHFDYYKYRWGAQQAAPQVEMIPASQCPCLSVEPAANDAPAATPAYAAPPTAAAMPTGPAF